MGFLRDLFDSSPVGQLWNAYDGSTLQDAVEKGPIGMDALAMRETFRGQENTSRAIGGDFGDKMGDNFAWWEKDANSNLDKPERALGKAAATLSLMYGGYPAWAAAMGSLGSSAANGGNAEENLRAFGTGAIAGGVSGGVASTASPYVGAATGSALGAGAGSYTGSKLSGASDSDALRGAGNSALMSFTPGVGQYASDNPYVKNAIDGAVQGGIQSKVQGDNVQQGAIRGGVTGLARAYGNGNTKSSQTTGDAMPDTGTLGGTLQDMYGESSATLGGYAPREQYEANQDLGMYGRSTPLSIEGRGDASGGGGGATQSSFSFDYAPITDFFSRLAPSSPSQWGDLLQGLGGLYQAQEARKQAKQLQEMLGMRRDAYSSQLRNNLMRRDAAAGRRSNYEGRETELQAALAGLDSRNAPMMAEVNRAKNQALAGSLQSLFRYAGKSGAFRNQPTVNQQSSVPTNNYLFSTQPSQSDFSLGQLNLGNYGRKPVFGEGP